MNTQTLPIGTILDSGLHRYSIVKVLGQGGFGITYKAEARVKVGNISLTGTFAIKEHFVKQYNDREGCNVTIPNKSNAADVNDSLQAFRTEAQRLNRLSLEHPGIVKVNECFDANGTAYYVMEFVEGQSLRDYVERHDGGRLPEDEAKSIIRQVGNSLTYLHSHHVTHLDVKPDNILLRDDGTPVLIDLGLAKHYDSKGHATSTLKVGGTSDGYSPLEQYAGIDSFSPQSDVYALAATLLFMLTGRDPKKALVETEGHIRQSLGGVAGDAVADAIVHAMQKLHEQRTESVTDFLQELDRDNAEATSVEAATNIPVEDEPTENSTEVLQNEPTGNSTEVLQLQGSRTKKSKTLPIALAALAALAIIVAILLFTGKGNKNEILETGAEAELPNKEGASVEETSNGNLICSINNVQFTMIRVEGGTFTMGATSEQGSDADSDENPAHSVTLSTYYMGETEVTQALWQAVMGSNPSNFKGDSSPVDNVSWNDCQEFIRKLNQLTGRSFRLPTEAEWEYAARGGNKNRHYKYSGSNDVGSVAWYTSNSGGETHPVKTRQPNELGLYDMSGNVWEWCSDWWGSYSSEAQTNPKGAATGSNRVNRGGGWGSSARYCRVSNRDYGTPGDRNYYQGLRLAL